MYQVFQAIPAVKDQRVQLDSQGPWASLGKKANGVKLAKLGRLDNAVPRALRVNVGCQDLQENQDQREILDMMGPLGL